jgi:hypothetical protein
MIFKINELCAAQYLDLLFLFSHNISASLETALSGVWTITNERIRVQSAKRWKQGQSACKRWSRSAHVYVSGSDDNPHGTGTGKKRSRNRV